MPRGSRFKLVETTGRRLPDVEVTTMYGKPALKVRGKMFVCIASHPSAEPDTLFRYLSDVNNLPSYFAAMKAAEPAEGQAVALQGFRFTAEAVQGRRVTTILVTREAEATPRG